MRICIVSIDFPWLRQSIIGKIDYIIYYIKQIKMLSGWKICLHKLSAFSFQVFDEWSKKTRMHGYMQRKVCYHVCMTMYTPAKFWLRSRRESWWVFGWRDSRDLSLVKNSPRFSWFQNLAEKLAKISTRNSTSFWPQKSWSLPEILIKNINFSHEKWMPFFLQEVVQFCKLLLSSSVHATIILMPAGLQTRCFTS